MTEKKRQHYIDVAAYNIAESKGFIGGCDLENWFTTEAEIDRLLAEDKL